MTMQEFRKAIFDNGDDAYFRYNGKAAGIEPTVKNSSFSFEVWHGEKWKVYDSFRDMVYDPFFDGKSFAELLNEVTIEFL